VILAIDNSSLILVRVFPDLDTNVAFKPHASNFLFYRTPHIRMCNCSKTERIHGMKPPDIITAISESCDLMTFLIAEGR